MPTSGVLWNQIVAEATAQAARLGVPENTERYNAFFHVYVSARLVQLVGEAGAFVSGSGLELKNHWDYRRNPDKFEDPNRRFEEARDPNKRRDSFRDLWNNAVGREIGKIGTFNKWAPEQIAEYSKNAVTQPVGPHAEPVAIVNILDQITLDDHRRDTRLKGDLSRLSTLDYQLRSEYPAASDIHRAAPPGTRFPPPLPSIGRDSASYRPTRKDRQPLDDTAPFSRTNTEVRDDDITHLARPTTAISPERVDREDKIVGDRMAELQRLMADRHSDYWNDPHADVLQAEYRDLLERREKDTLTDDELWPSAKFGA